LFNHSIKSPRKQGNQENIYFIFLKFFLTVHLVVVNLNVEKKIVQKNVSVLSLSVLDVLMKVIANYLERDAMDVLIVQNQIHSVPNAKIKEPVQ